MSFRLTDDELMNTISIRISTVEFFDNCVFAGGNIDTKLIQKVLETLYFNTLPTNIIGSVEKQLEL